MHIKETLPKQTKAQNQTTQTKINSRVLKRMESQLQVLFARQVFRLWLGLDLNIISPFLPLSYCDKAYSSRQFKEVDAWYLHFA